MQSWIALSKLGKLVDVSFDRGIPWLSCSSTYAVSWTGFIEISPRIIEFTYSVGRIKESIIDSVDFVGGDVANIEVSGVNLPVSVINSNNSPGFSR